MWPVTCEVVSQLGPSRCWSLSKLAWCMSWTGGFTNVLGFLCSCIALILLVKRLEQPRFPFMTFLFITTCCKKITSFLFFFSLGKLWHSEMKSKSRRKWSLRWLFFMPWTAIILSDSFDFSGMKSLLQVLPLISVEV